MLPSRSQVSLPEINHFFSAHPATQESASAVGRFYEASGYEMVWLAGKLAPVSNLLKLVRQSSQWGMRPPDYAINFLDSILNGTVPLLTREDSLFAELRVTVACTRLFNDIAYGNTTPGFGYDGLKYAPACHDIPALLAFAVPRQQLDSVALLLTPGLPEITALQRKIRWLEKILSDPAFEEVVITSNRLSAANSPLVRKLYQLGITTDSVKTSSTEKEIKALVSESQRQFSLLPDGILRSTVLAQLNVPVSVRLQQCSLSINYYRWLSCIQREGAVIVVNIPAAYMKVYRHDLVILEMRMVLGRKTTPTPTLTGRVSEVILYPYWHVPFSIATREMLPQIKKDPGIIPAGNFQVLGKDGKIMDPYKINWQALSTRYFPYVIRQSTGCDNALGLLKLNFLNPFGVYLHDTPYKGAFMLNKRFFSHGCLRMEDPMTLGHLVLKNNPLAIDTLEQKGCLRNQSPIVVPADEQMPVVVWYNPAGVDSTGRVVFFEDVYARFGK
jgi:murein L,D-transpeptidase YcbB/YkuD